MYKLAVEMADRVSARRGSANSFFSGIHAALAGAIGILGPVTLRPAEADAVLMGSGLTVVAAVGILLCVVWYVLLRSYRDLNQAKFKVIADLESTMAVPLFAREWEILKGDPVERWRDQYAEFGDIERLVPVLFGLVYAAMIVLIWTTWT